MADGKTFEYGSSASEVQFQDEIGKVKNRQGEAVLEVNDDQEVMLATSGTAVKIKTFIDDDTMATANDTSLATSESIKAYVDASGATAPGGDAKTIQFNSDPAGTFSGNTNLTYDLSAVRMAVNASDMVVTEDGAVVLYADGTPAGTQRVGVGTDSPDRKLEIFDDGGNPQLRLTHTDNTEYVEFQSLASGDAAIKMTDSELYVRSGDSNSCLQIQNTTTGFADGFTDGMTVGCNGYAGYVWMRDATSTLSIGAGGSGGITLDADNNIAVLEGSFQLKAEIVAPSAPVAGDGGIFYVKSDGIPYYVSDTTAETSLVGGGGGSSDLTITSVTSGVTYSATTYNTMYIVNVGNAIEIDLPTAGSNAGKTIDVLSAQGASYTVTVDPNGSETINGDSSSLLLTTNYANVTLVSDGTNWVIR